MKFSVTYEIVTPESAEQGDAESRGFICWDVTLREALQSLFETRTSQVDGISAIEPNDSEYQRARWMTVYNGAEYLTGANESRSIHFPERVTGATRARLVRLVLRGHS